MPKKQVVSPKIKQELQLRIEAVNLVPDANQDEWNVFWGFAKETIQEFERLKTDPNFTKDCCDNFEIEDLLIAEFRAKVPRIEPAKFREFARSLEFAIAAIDSDERDARWAIQLARAEREELRELIEAAKDNDGGGWVVSRSERFLLLENSIPFEQDRGDAVSLLIRYKVPLTRLNICAACSKVYWVKYRGAETCGKRKCINDLNNWKRKDRITEFRISWSSKKDG